MLVAPEKFNFRYGLFQGKTPIRSAGKAEKIGLKKFGAKNPAPPFSNVNFRLTGVSMTAVSHIHKYMFRHL